MSHGSGHMRNLGTGGVDGKELGRRRFDRSAVWGRVGSENYRIEITIVLVAEGEIELVRVGDKFSVFLQSSCSRKLMAQKLGAGWSTLNGVNQRLKLSNIQWAAGASIIALQGLFRLSEPSKAHTESLPKRSMMAPAVGNFEKWK